MAWYYLFLILSLATLLFAVIFNTVRGLIAGLIVGVVIVFAILILGISFNPIVSNGTTVQVTAPQAQAQAVTAPAQQAPQAAAVAPATNAGQQAGGGGQLSGPMVAQWCSQNPKGTAADCDPSRFSQLIEANGLTNPYGVHMEAGNQVSISVPAGYKVDNWDCFNAGPVFGPATIKSCQLTVRKQ